SRYLKHLEYEVAIHFCLYMVDLVFPHHENEIAFRAVLLVTRVTVAILPRP
ncbi:hypothetical protein IFM89_027006, partial [Coptis chinensis]